MKKKSAIFSCVALFFFSLFLFACGNNNSSQNSQANDSASNISPDSSVQNPKSALTDTMSSAASRRRSTAVYEMWWSASDFLSRYRKVDTIKFTLHKEQTRYIVKGQVKIGPNTSAVTLNKIGDPVVLTSNSPDDDSLWIRDYYYLPRKDVVSFIADVIKEEHFRDLNTNLAKYVIDIKPVLDTEVVDGKEKQFIRVELRVQNTSSYEKSITFRSPNPCPVCPKLELAE
jgi:hypothetical protein